MCYECQGIDRTIGHYQQLGRLTTDRRTLDSIDILIARLEADKNALHRGTTPTTEASTRPGRLQVRKITEPLPRFTAPLPEERG